ncbi:hypothetical protein A3G55_03015 [Candidatus Giovannonibacteria bacterium RIFCSPLOWO2_12_FULL_44_25]|uniref:Uncharacterized protein n=3 Tax=Parcubacteria group TaxID=1794811 RepID=A0A837IGV0_9BACT|nr:MAG: hypothetical protein UW15_C0009G0025 [Parcubacteria group bacterium GW2011_GWC1_44_10]KKT59994.1 MAG: hypothetical protein UW53_C0004G0006 [Candidatus Giovannonibacteria bacterium GW2011_GWA1_44_25]KKU12619.1 MAG: hypothetical protein UX18_C0017G0005 [Candidatus Azambacteria bacterium GW2011_GWC2_45_7b]KKU30112.1 MAG: hypothetical protein UX43_C0002G0006 [Candidatus Giovannonibacteria bacterium GW2011_GWB1_46_20]OGF49695.1 MAG: hypothetical protein A2120_00075 [Candidatus Giovannonibact
MDKNQHKEEPRKLKPIPEFSRFLLDESWLPTLLLVGMSVLFLTESFLLGGIAGLFAAVVIRATIMLTLRFVFKIDPQLVKPHNRLGKLFNDFPGIFVRKIR